MELITIAYVRKADAYASKEAAFEAATANATNAIKLGYEVILKAQGSKADESTLGN